MIEQGKIVILVGGVHLNNHQNEHAGIITRVFGADVNYAGQPYRANLMVFPDGSLPILRPSMLVYENLETANLNKAQTPFAYLKG